MKDIDTESESQKSNGGKNRVYVDDFLGDAGANRNRSLSPLMVLGLIVGVVLLFWGYRQTYTADETIYQSIKARAFASKKWPSVLGTITKSRFIYHPDFRGRSSDPYYTLEIIFEYVVSGDTFTNSQVCFPNPRLQTENECQSYLAKFPEGASVKVFYDPSNAKVSCLMNGVTTSLRRNIHWREEYLTKPEPEEATQ